MTVTNEEALQWFERELEDGKCSEDCPQCNANERAIFALRALDDLNDLQAELTLAYFDLRRMEKAFAVACRMIGDVSWTLARETIFDVVDNENVCRVCGCTDRNACPGGCYWVAPDLCSACAEAGEVSDGRAKN